MEQSDRRRSPRYIFFASAEVTDGSPESTVKTHTSELARYGCYLDMMNPFPSGSSLRIGITHEGQRVEAATHVIHSQPNVGMGIVFDRIEPEQEQILAQWLGDLQRTGL